MPPRDWSIRVKDILDAVAKNRRYVHGMSLEAFLGDEKTVDAVIRNFSVIGEAAARIPTTVRKKYSAIPWVKMIAMRNFVVHEYFGISERVLLTTVQNDLPAIEPLLSAILHEHEKLKAAPAVKKPKKPRKSKK